MSGRLVVSDEVREIVPTDELEAAVGRRETTELTCAVCKAKMLPESEAPVSLLVVRDRSGQFGEVQFAHESCHPSAIHTLPYEISRSEAAELLGSPSGVSITVAVRSSFAPRALILCESHRPLAGDVNLQPYVQAGLAPSEEGLQTLCGPLITTLTVRLEDRTLILEGPDVGDTVELGDVTPPEWFDVLDEDGAALVIVGNRLGLDRFSAERVDAQLALGQAIAGVVAVAQPPAKARRRWNPLRR